MFLVVTLKGKGRHDPCVVPRAVPIVESMAANVIVFLFCLPKNQADIGSVGSL